MSSRSLPSFLSSVSSKTEKDRPLREAEVPEVWGHFEGLVRVSIFQAGLSSSLADDAVQETAVAFLRAVRAGRIPAAVPVIRSFLWVAGRNLAKSQRRWARHDRHDSVDDEEQGLVLPANDVCPESAAESREFVERIHALGSGTMSRCLWEVVERHLNGDSHKEIESALGLTPECVRSRLHRGLPKLREALAAEGVLGSSERKVA